MKHRIRINGEVQEIDCELSSEYHDCKGREIFENDIVRHSICGEIKNYPVKYEEGEFFLGRFSLSSFGESRLEIVGHITEEVNQ